MSEILTRDVMGVFALGVLWLNTLLVAAAALAFPDAQVATATTLAQAQSALAQPPDLALVDLGLPDGSGIDFIATALARHPAMTCVVATVFDDDAHLFPALRAGAQGYVLKDAQAADLAAMLRGIVDGQPPLSPSIARRVLRHFAAAAPLPVDDAKASGERLTAREEDVLREIARGMSNKEIARTLDIAETTVKIHVQHILRKLGLTSRVQAAVYASDRQRVE